jgi:hypothetical protein
MNKKDENREIWRSELEMGQLFLMKRNLKLHNYIIVKKKREREKLRLKQTKLTETK